MKFDVLSELSNITGDKEKLEWMLLNENRLTGEDLRLIETSPYIPDSVKEHCSDILQQMALLTESGLINYSSTLREYQRACKQYIDQYKFTVLPTKDKPTSKKKDISTDEFKD